MNADRIKEIIAEQLGFAASNVTPEKSLRGDLAADSLDDVEMVMRFEDELGIEIDDYEFETIKTVQQVIDFITTKIPA